MEESMDLGALRDSIRLVLTEECPHEFVVKHAQSGNGMSRPLWDKAVELGWTMLNVPETDGGLGLGIEALTILYEELGRAAAPLPFLGSLLAIDSLSASASPEQRAAWLPRCAEGAVVCTATPSTIAQPAMTAEITGGQVRLSGTATDLFDAADADILLLLARDSSGGLVRVLVDVQSDGVAMTRETLWDRGHSLSTLALDGLVLPADRAYPTSEAAEAALTDHTAVALAAQAVGGQDALLALTIEYLKTREQFGRPLGSFQALKHRVADHQTRVEGDRHLLGSAVTAIRAGRADASQEASAAKALACANYVELGRDAIQLHGGIGFTAEYPCHVFVKSAFLNEQLFGGRSFHLHRSAARIMAGAA
jgi:alkylation response protein AidB-like acyl-CoA dehydrogenase